MIEKTCRVSGNKFQIEKEDLEFYAKMEVITAENLSDLLSGKIVDCVGLPTLCPAERQRRRMCWRNERKLYKRKCDATKKDIISIYDASADFPVYEQSHWWSDKWDALDYAQDLNFEQPFFEQFEALMKKVPKKNFFQDGINENSLYTNCAGYNKNCYFVTNGAYNEDCSFSRGLSHCRDSFEIYFAGKCELGYELIDCENCFDLKYSQNCRNCSDSWFLKNCIGCNNCFGSVNLRNKEYYFLNKKLTKEDYDKELKKLALFKSSNLLGMRKKFLKFVAQHPQKNLEMFFSENSVGDFIQQSKNCIDSFEVTKCEDVKYSDFVKFTKSSQDVLGFGYESELLYETVGLGYSNNIYVGLIGEKNVDSNFVFECANVTDCFGCVGLKHKKYCILNKQYSKDEYFELKEKIIAHMKKTGEWGEFFPASMSPFAYNETVANEYFPLTKIEAEKRGYKWKEASTEKKTENEKAAKIFDWKKIPDDINEVTDEILQTVLYCVESKKPYRIKKAELKFYRKMNLPIPRLHPDVRHANRMALRNPRKLWKRNCGDCNCEIQTTFAPDRPEKILCENCYLKVVD